MATLNLSSNGPSIKSSYGGIVNSPMPSGPAANSSTYGQWAVFSVSTPLVNAFQQDGGNKESVLKVQNTGEGELIDLIEDFSEGRIQFAFVKVKDSNTTLPKYVLIGWCGEGVPERTKGYFTSHLAAVSKVLHGYHVQITARSDRDLTPEGIVKKVADASGAKYSAETSVSSGESSSSSASKPAFTPSKSGTGSTFNPLTSRSRQPGTTSGAVDEDGWGTDAPEVTRSQLEKVQSAYKPTKVNMAELTKQQQEPSRFNNNGQGSSSADNSNVVKGGYQPIGKVDIAAIRAQAKEAKDDRPTTVKGAYEPVGKVDIAAIRAKAQRPADSISPASAPSDNASEADASEANAPKSLAERSTAFTQSERMTTLPRPKVANNFGSSRSNFAGTKAPTPGTFGLQSAPALAKAAPVGTASRTFADEGGKTPAQIWAEKKARERGDSGAGRSTSAELGHSTGTQDTGRSERTSGYSGKSWAAVPTNTTGRSGAADVTQDSADQDESQAEETTTSTSGGVRALRDQFKSAPPMGVAASKRDEIEEDSAPPPSKPSRPIGGVAMPGLPARGNPDEEEVDEDEEETPGPNIPPPPRVQRSPTPESPAERDMSPIRVAKPVARSKEPTFEAPEERLSPPVMPVREIENSLPEEDELTEEPQGHDPARGAGVAMAQATFGHTPSATNEQLSHAAGKTAIVQYDYEKAEGNEIELAEGERVTNIEMVDDDWWMGTNAKGESGLFPSNYVELVEDDDHGHTEAEPQPASHEVSHASAAPAASSTPATASGPTATAVYDYEAAEDNELSFAEGAVITELEFPDEDWWFGHHRGQSGLFPSNYVQLDE